MSLVYQSVELKKKNWKSYENSGQIARPWTINRFEWKKKEFIYVNASRTFGNMQMTSENLIEY